MVSRKQQTEQLQGYITHEVIALLQEAVRDGELDQSQCDHLSQHLEQAIIWLEQNEGLTDNQFS